MFGIHPFSDEPWSSLPSEFAVVDDIVVGRYATHFFVDNTTPSDGIVYDNRVISPLTVERSIYNGPNQRIGGFMSMSGRVVLNNMDGHFDPLLSFGGVDGRRIIVRMSKLMTPEEFIDSSDFIGTIFDGVIESWQSDLDQLVISTRDNMELLQVPIQETVYSGAGGVNGGDDLKGKPKPLCWGEVYNIPAVLVDASNLIYQVHNGQIQAVDAVRDRGISLTKVGGVPSLGEYQEDTTNGRFTLGGAPAGLVTADVRGSNTPDYVNTTPTIIRRVLESRLGFNSNDFDNPAYALLVSNATQTAGVWVPPEIVGVGTVIDFLIKGIGGYIGYNRLGKMKMGLFDVATGVDKVDWNTDDIIQVEREVLRPAWRQRVGWRRNYALQDDLAGAVTDAVRTFSSEEYRLESDSNSVVQTAHQLAVEHAFLRSPMVNKADALAEATRQLTIYDQAPTIYWVTVSRKMYDIFIGDVVCITFPRFGLSGGVNGRVVSVKIDALRNEGTFGVFMRQ